MDQPQLAMLSVVVVAEALVLWCSRRLALRRVVSAILAVIAGLAGYLALMAYAIPELSDFHSPHASLRTAILGNMFIWGLSLGALALALRFFLYAVRPPRAKASK